MMKTTPAAAATDTKMRYPPRNIEFFDRLDEEEEDDKLNENNKRYRRKNKKKRKCCRNKCKGVAEEEQITVSLTQDLVFDILSRLPARFLLTNMESVSRTWWAQMARDRHFIQKNLLHAKPGGVIAQYISSMGRPYHTRYLEMSRESNACGGVYNVNVTDWGTFPALFQKGSSCDGLVMFSNSEGLLHFVYNPATCESFQVPNPPRSKLGVSPYPFTFARLPSTGEIKLFHLWVADRRGEARVEAYDAHVYVLTLGIDTCWREIMCGAEGVGVFTLDSNPILRSTGRFVYWITWNRTTILDATNETIRVIRNPFRFFDEGQFLTMGCDSCCVCAIFPLYSSSFTYNMYVLDASACTWSSPMRMNYPLLLRPYGYENIKFIIFLGMFDTELLILVQDKNNNSQWCFIHDLETYTLTRINAVTYNNMRFRKKKILTIRMRIDENSLGHNLLHSNLTGTYNMLTHANSLVSLSSSVS